MKNTFWKDLGITLTILIIAFLISLLFQHVFDIYEHISTLFAFAVFLISLWTQGYFWGVAAAFAGTLAINYVFAFPYFAFDFITPVNLISAVVMVTIALLTGALTTKIKRQEAIKAESEKERMRANLLRAISHDLRTPLTNIYGSASALSENGDSLSPVQKEKMLEGIREDSMWLVRMVENLLAVTRMDSGNVKLSKCPIVADELADAVLTKLKKHYPNQTVTAELPEDILILSADAILLEQVLLNLLENAVLHAHGMTELILQIRPANGKAEIAVLDNGCGLPTQKIADLCSAGKDEGSSLSDSRKKNTGIGLSVCDSIIKAHGGELIAENRPLGGAAFRFKIETEESCDE